jgi:hypothetical protein
MQPGNEESYGSHSFSRLATSSPNLSRLTAIRLMIKAGEQADGHSFSFYARKISFYARTNKRGQA